MPEVKTEKYLLYALQALKGLEEDMAVLTSHDAKADPEVIEELLDEIITRCLVPACAQLGVEDPLEAMLEEIDPTDIFESELERNIDDLDDDEDYEDDDEDEEEEEVTSTKQRVKAR